MVERSSYDKLLNLFQDGTIFEPNTPREFLIRHHIMNMSWEIKNSRLCYCQSAELGDTKAMTQLAKILIGKKDMTWLKSISKSS